MKTYFDHEKLDVYQYAINFVSWVDDLLEEILVRIVSMLVGLIRSTSNNRVYEESSEYGQDL